MSLLQIKDLTHFFGGLRAVYDFNLNMEEGELVGLIGPNGAGKTTIFNLVTGAYKPTEGEVRLNGDNMVGLQPHQITTKGVARTFQTIRLWNELTVLDNIRIAHASRVRYSLLDSILHSQRYWEEESDIKEQAMELANDSIYGLTAGFYGSEEEAQWFFENIQAGVTYANRPQGSTTGAWPGFQPFGGWKGSGSTGRNAGGHYYLLNYMREQVHTLIR